MGLAWKRRKRRGLTLAQANSILKEVYLEPLKAKLQEPSMTSVLMADMNRQGYGEGYIPPKYKKPTFWQRRRRWVRNVGMRLREKLARRIAPWYVDRYD